MDKTIVNSNEVILCPCRTPEEVLAARGVKPTLSPNLNTLALVEVIKPFTLACCAEAVQNNFLHFKCVGKMSKECFNFV